MKPQVILKTEDEYGVHFIKKWPWGLAIEGHTPEAALSHNMNVPNYFFTIDEEYAKEQFRLAGKEFR